MKGERHGEFSSITTFLIVLRHQVFGEGAFAYLFIFSSLLLKPWFNSRFNQNIKYIIFFKGIIYDCHTLALQLTRLNCHLQLIMTIMCMYDLSNNKITFSP